MVRRTTTGMSLNLYRYNLSGSTSRLAKAQEGVLSHRKFTSYAEDPSSATQAWRVRRAMVNTESYIKNTHDTYTRFNIAWNTLDIASYKLTDLDGRSADIYAASDPTASGRVALGRVLMQTAESVAQVLNNAKSGEDFLFAGDDELNAPFSWQTIDGKKVLFYRGVNVNAGLVKSPAEAPDWVPQMSGEIPDPLPDDFDTTADVTDTAALAQAYRDSLPKSSKAANWNDRKWEQAWIDYYKDTTGSATMPKAEDYIVTKRVPDKTTVDDDGNTIFPDGSIVDPDGNVVDEDGNVISGATYNDNGTVTRADGSTVYPDGTIIDDTGVIHHTDGSETNPGEIVTNSDGSMICPNGTVINPDGSVCELTGEIQEVPDWVPMDTTVDPAEPLKNDAEAALAAEFIKNLPEQGTAAYDEASDIEKAWIDYYKYSDIGMPKPTQDPSEAWEAANGVDDYGTIKGLSALLSKEEGESAYNRAWAAYLKDQGDVAKLEAMSKEQMPVDLGMGLLEHDSTTLINGTYFDRSLPGINMLGWGIDEDGDPKNVCMIMMRLGEIYADCNPESGNYDHDLVTGNSEKGQALYEEAMRLLDKLKLGKEYVTDQYVQVTTKASFLDETEDHLTLQKDYLNEQLTGLEDVDLADAITQFSWDYYCYSAALKVGTQLLSQSLIDYMS